MLSANMILPSTTTEHGAHAVMLRLGATLHSFATPLNLGTTRRDSPFLTSPIVAVESEQPAVNTSIVRGGFMILFWFWRSCFGFAARHGAAGFFHGFPAGFAFIGPVVLLHAHGLLRVCAQSDAGQGQRRQKRQRSSNLFDEVCFHLCTLNLGGGSRVKCFCSGSSATARSDSVFFSRLASRGEVHAITLELRKTSFETRRVSTVRW